MATKTTFTSGAVQQDFVEYTYDKNGLQTEIKLNGALQYKYTYGPDGRLLAAKDYSVAPLAQTVTHYYPAYNIARRRDVIWPDGFKTRTDCGQLGRPITLETWREGNVFMGARATFYCLCYSSLIYPPL